MDKPYNKNKEEDEVPSDEIEEIEGTDDEDDEDDEDNVTEGPEDD